MGSFLFNLNNYHAVKSASIKIDGITVLAGVNGCGKSTISKWLYYIVNSINGFEDDNFHAFANEVQNKLSRYTRVISDPRVRSSAQTAVRKASDYNTLEDNFKRALSSLSEAMHKLIGRSTNDMLLSSRLEFLGIKVPKGSSPEKTIDKFILSAEDWYRNEYQRTSDRNNSRTLEDLYQNILTKYSTGDTFPDSIDISENKLNIIDIEASDGTRSFKEIISVKDAIYIDTAMSFIPSGIFSETRIITDHLKERMSNNSTGAIRYIELLKYIACILEGQIDFDESAFDKELVYKRNDGLTIPLENAATGIKSIAILYRLIASNAITEDTLLLIDEPEAHLHPQWIVEYARILVMIRKITGAKIMIASHNPDMVAAVQSIATKESILKDTNFYLAEKNHKSSTYTYKYLKNDISDIFESFNIAIDRIQTYGTNIF